jgi:uncharacterized membrane protein
MMPSLYAVMMQNILIVLTILLVFLLIIFIGLKYKNKKSIKKNTLDTTITKKPNVELTDEFKKLVGDVDLTLEKNDVDVRALEDIEETLLALKELYEKEYISQDEYQTRTDAIIKSLDNKHGS